METSDIGRRVRIFDRPDDPSKQGFVATIIHVYGPLSFRVRNEKGFDSEFHNFTGRIYWLDGEV